MQFLFLLITLLTFIKTTHDYNVTIVPKTPKEIKQNKETATKLIVAVYSCLLYSYFLKFAII